MRLKYWQKLVMHLGAVFIMPASLAHASNDNAMTIQICEKTMVYHDSAIDDDGQVGKSGWPDKQVASLATIFETVAAELCAQEVIKIIDLTNFGEVNFYNNPNANIISIYGEDIGAGPRLMTIEIPSLSEYSSKDFKTEIRRAMLCIFDPESKELDETACLPD